MLENAHRGAETRSFSLIYFREMNIGFDGKRAVQNFTGLGNYSRYVIENLYRYYPQHDYTLYAPKEKQEKPFLEMMHQCPALRCVYPEGVWKQAKAAWRSWGVTPQLERDGIEIYHGLSNELPLNIRKAKGVRSVVTIHDLIFLRHPEFYPAIDRKIYAYKFRQACLQADAIIAVSECTKRDIQEFFHIPEEKIHVVYQGCNPIFTQPVSKEERQRVRQKYHLGERRYVLNVGTLEARKNAAQLASAFGHCPTGMLLVLVGRRTPYVKEILRNLCVFLPKDAVHILDHVPTEDLPALYAEAELFVYPSRYEGFGIPILEALNVGVPVVAATGSCLEEAGGPDSCYLSPASGDELGFLLEDLLDAPEQRARMVERGKIYAQRFAPEKQMAKLMKVYESLLK